MYTTRPKGIRVRRKPMAVKPAWFFVQCMSISFARQLSHVGATGCQAHAVGHCTCHGMGAQETFCARSNPVASSLYARVHTKQGDVSVGEGESAWTRR